MWSQQEPAMVTATAAQPHVPISEEPAIAAAMASRPRVSMTDLRVMLRQRMRDIPGVDKPPGHFPSALQQVNCRMAEPAEPQEVHDPRSIYKPPGNLPHPQMHHGIVEAADGRGAREYRDVRKPLGQHAQPQMYADMDPVDPQGVHDYQDLHQAPPGYLPHPQVPPPQVYRGHAEAVVDPIHVREPRDFHKPPGQLAAPPQMYSEIMDAADAQHVYDYQDMQPLPPPPSYFQPHRRPQQYRGHVAAPPPPQVVRSYDQQDIYSPPCQAAPRHHVYHEIIEAAECQGVRSYEDIRRHQNHPCHAPHPQMAGVMEGPPHYQSEHDYQDIRRLPCHLPHPRSVEALDYQNAPADFQELYAPPQKQHFAQPHAIGSIDELPDNNMAAPRRRSSNERAPGGLTHPQINCAIIKAADSQNLNLLIQTVEAHLPSMNIVNISTSMYRFGKLASDWPKLRSKSAPVVAKLVVAAQASLERLEPGDCPTQAISNVAWSLAYLQRQERDLMSLLASLATTGLRKFKYIELSSLLWAFAKLGADKMMPGATQTLFFAAAEALEGVLWELPMRTLSTVSWAFATAKQEPSGWFRSLSVEIQRKAGDARPQEISNIVWAFGTVGYKDNTMLDALGDAAASQLSHFKAQEVSNTLWGFAANSYYHPAFFRDSVVHANRLELNAQHLANILWACARVRPRHTATRAALLMLVPRCSSVMDTLKPQECASMLLAISKVFGGTTKKRAGCPSGGLQDAGCPQEVLNFCHSAERWAPSRVGSFSAQSLVNIISSCAALGLERLASAAQAEVLRRSLKLSAPGLVVLLRGLLSNPGIPFAVVCPVAQSLTQKFPWSSSESSSLARLYMSQWPEREEEPSQKELRDWCSQLSLGTSPSACAPLLQHGKKQAWCGLPEDVENPDAALYHVKNTFVECVDEEVVAMRTEANFFCSAPPLVRREAASSSSEVAA